MCHITSNIRGFSRSLSLSVWQLYVAYGKHHHIISRRLKRLPEQNCEIRLELYVIFINRFNACFDNIEKKSHLCLHRCCFFWNAADIHLQHLKHTSMHVQNNLYKFKLRHRLWPNFIGNFACLHFECFAYSNTGINWMTSIMQIDKEEV